MSRTQDVELQFSADFQEIQQSLGSLEGYIQNWTQSIRRLGIAAFASWVGNEVLQTLRAGLNAVVGFARSALAEAMETRGVEARLASVIRATGTAAGRTVPQLTAMADQLERLTKVDDNRIKTVMAQVLAFPDIQGENFDRAIKAILDTTALGFGTLEGNALQLAKALSYPTSGLDGLSKSGVKFTETQKEQLKILDEMGEKHLAQKIILEAVEIGVKGASGASADANKAQLSWNLALQNFKEDVGKGMLPLYDAMSSSLGGKLEPALNQAAKSFSDWLAMIDPKKVEEFTTSIASLVEGLLQLSLAFTTQVLPMLSSLWEKASQFANTPMGQARDAAGQGGLLGGMPRWRAALTAISPLMGSFLDVGEQVAGDVSEMKMLADRYQAARTRNRASSVRTAGFEQIGFANSIMGRRDAFVTSRGDVSGLSPAMQDWQTNMIANYFAQRDLFGPLGNLGMGAIGGLSTLGTAGGPMSMRWDDTRTRREREEAILRMAGPATSPFRGGFESGDETFRRISAAAGSDKEDKQLDTQQSILTEMRDEILKQRDRDKVQESILDEMKKRPVAVAG